VRSMTVLFVCVKKAEPVEMPFRTDSREFKEPCIKSRCTLTPPGEYDKSVCKAAAMRTVATIAVATLPLLILWLSIANTESATDCCGVKLTCLYNEVINNDCIYAECGDVTLGGADDGCRQYRRTTRAGP